VIQDEANGVRGGFSKAGVGERRDDGLVSPSLGDWACHNNAMKHFLSSSASGSGALNIVCENSRDYLCTSFPYNEEQV
jgi:hypothetical protein